MAVDPQAAIHAVRMKRIRQAAQLLEQALSEGHDVSRELLELSGLLDRGIDPLAVRATGADIERLLAITRRLEAEGLDASPPPDARPAARRVQV